ncbi:hypothetical protein TI39_contig4456g00001, partial [Zymoseptoria brevis]
MARKSQSSSSKLHARQNKTVNDQLARQQHIDHLRQKRHFLHKQGVSMHHTLAALEALHHSEGNIDSSTHPQPIHPLREDTRALLEEMQNDIKDQLKSINASKQKKTVMRRRKVNATWKHIHKSAECLQEHFECGLRIDQDVRRELDQQEKRIKAAVYRQMSTEDNSRTSLVRYLTLLHVVEAGIEEDLRNASDDLVQEEDGAE